MDRRACPQQCRDLLTGANLSQTYAYGVDFDSSSPSLMGTCPACGSAYKRTTFLEERAVVSVVVDPNTRNCSTGATATATGASSGDTATRAATPKQLVRVVLRGEQTAGAALGSTVLVLRPNVCAPLFCTHTRCA